MLYTNPTFHKTPMEHPVAKDAYKEVLTGGAWPWLRVPVLESDAWARTHFGYVARAGDSASLSLFPHCQVGK